MTTEEHLKIESVAPLAVYIMFIFGMILKDFEILLETLKVVKKYI
jgi:hypothetical protein